MRVIQPIFNLKYPLAQRWVLGEQLREQADLDKTHLDDILQRHD